MSVASLACSDAAALDDTRAVLARIVDPQVHLALWQRPLPDALAGLAALNWDDIDDIDEDIAVEALAATVPALIADSGYGALAPPLSREIVALGQQFGTIMGCAIVRLRLEVIETDACRKFHADNVTARLLMPLVGPGTQWRQAGGEGPIEALRPGDVGIFKGKLWAEEPLILHRSPPVADTGETRLLLAFNPRDEDMPG